MRTSLMKKLVTSLALTATLAAPTAVLTALNASPADAGGSACATRTEFRNVHRGMTEGRVTRIFDSRGRVSFQGSGYKSKEWNTCTSQYGFVWVDFERRNGAFRVTTKTAFWG
jgi:hypothetical protein